MSDDISPNEVPFEEIIGTSHVRDPEALSPQQAMVIAARESIVIGPPYAIAVCSVAGDMCKLEVTRLIGGVPRSQSAAVGRRRSEGEFAEACRKVWLMLLDEHEREKAL